MRLSLLQSELWTTTAHQHTLAQFLMVDVHESIHPCLCGTTRPGLQYSCAVSVLCDVDLLLLPSTWKHFRYLRVCETIVHCVLIDLDADQSPAHKASSFRWDRCYAHLSTVNGLTFLTTSNHTEIPSNVLVSVPQLSGVMLILVVSSCVRGALHCLNWEQQRVCWLSLMSSNIPQSTTPAFNVVCGQLCSSLCFVAIEVAF